MSHRILVVDGEGRLADHFQLDRYDLSRSIDQQTLVEDIQLAMDQRPGKKILVLPSEAIGEAISAIEDALACLTDPYLGEDDGQRQQPTVQRLSLAKKTLKGAHFLELAFV